jgi:hypothetical protein
MVDGKKTRDPSATELSCPSCGAKVPSGATICWLCNTPVDVTSNQGWLSRAEAARARQNAAVQQAGGFSLASLLMLVTLICVVLGVFTIAPGLGVPLAVVAFATWLRTASLVRWRRATSGSSPTSAEVILIFLRSVAFTLLILALVGVAAVAAFGTLCFGLISAAEPSHGTSQFLGPFVISAIVLVAATLGIVATVRLQRRRWRRDRGEPK